MFAVADNAVGQSLRSKVAKLRTLDVSDAEGLRVWCRKGSGLGGRRGALIVVDAAVKVCSCVQRGRSKFAQKGLDGEDAGDG